MLLRLIWVISSLLVASIADVHTMSCLEMRPLLRGRRKEWIDHPFLQKKAAACKYYVISIYNGNRPRPDSNHFEWI